MRIASVVQRAVGTWVGILCLMAALAAPAAAARVELAYWLPDRGNQYTWFEGGFKLQSTFSREHVSTGCAYLYLRNDGKQPLTPKEFFWNGRPLPELRRELSMVWWRLRPDPLPPGATGEVILRPRGPLTAPATVRLTFTDGSAVQTRLAPAPPPIRIETVGFNAAMNEVFLVVEATDQRKHRLRRVWLDGMDVTSKCRLLNPAFTHGVSPVLLKLTQPLAYGSYHTYRVTTDAGESVACQVRTYDGWVPLGTYGTQEFEQFAQDGVNGHNSFRRHGQAELESQARLGMRGVMLLGDQPPAPEIRGHAGIFAYGPMDEPDAHDYGVEGIPMGQRIGYHALEMERRLRAYRTADPRHLGILTVNLTFKPANYFIYAPLADVVNPDCYPLNIGADAAMVRQVVETARYAAGPRPVTFTFQGCYEELADPGARAAKRFPRPPDPDEARLMIHYAIGAGARGLFNYIYGTEPSGGGVRRGSQEYPALWESIGQTYRELERVAPLLARAHPTRLATVNQPRVTVSTLLAGADALLLVVTNEQYTQSATAFQVTPARDVTLTLPRIPWLKPAAAYRVEANGLSPIRLTSTGDGTRLPLGTLRVSELLLVTGNAATAQSLDQRFQGRRRLVEAGIELGRQQAETREAALSRARQRLAGELADCMVMGRGIEAYGVQNPTHWNPRHESYWGFEFGQNEAVADRERGAEWTVEIPKERAGMKHLLFAVCGTWGQPGRFLLIGPDGRETLLREVSGGLPGQLLAIPVTFPAAGSYRVRFIQGGPGPKGGSIAHTIYVVPENRTPPALP